MGITLALVSSLLWGIADFAGGTASRRIPALLVVLVSQAVGLIVALGIATAVGGWNDPSGYLWWAIVAGLVEVAGLLAFYQALATGTMGVVSPIAALGVVIPVVVGLVTGHLPSVIVAVGFVLAILGVVAASGPERSAGRSLRPVLLAGVAAVCFGTTLLFIAQAARFSPVMTPVMMRMASVPTLAVIALLIRRRLTGRDGASGAGARHLLWTVVAVTGLFDVTSNMAFALASTAGAITIVAILGSLYPVVTVLLARVIHGERMRRVQQVGVAIALVGVTIIAGWS